METPKFVVGQEVEYVGYAKIGKGVVKAVEVCPVSGIATYRVKFPQYRVHQRIPESYLKAVANGL
jgi:hypothetical protein